MGTSGRTGGTGTMNGDTSSSERQASFESTPPPSSSLKSTVNGTTAAISGAVDTITAKLRETVVLDEENYGRPLAAFEPSAVETAYYAAPLSSTNDSHVSNYSAPEKPADFKDRYLFPVLTSSEKYRLNRLWWLTDGIQEDKNLQNHLESLVTMLKHSTGYETAILGLLDNDAFVRIAVNGSPMGCVPRRESPCSHTALQPAGTVFSIPDMQSDWRFAKSPYVDKGGMRSYAGTQLCFRHNDADEPAILGSLCIAHSSVLPPLTSLQEDTMVRIASAVVYALVSRAQIARQGAQRLMNERLSSLAGQEADTTKIIGRTLGVIEETFPGCKVSLATLDEKGTLSLIGGISIRPPVDTDTYLWENDAFIETWILTRNQESSANTQQSEAIRAIIVPVDETRYLLVQTQELRQVFDEIDALFVRSCGMLLVNTLQEGLLQGALQAKANFLRDVQHSLRTSLNGILSASEMLLEDATLQTIAESFPVKQPDPTSSLLSRALPVVVAGGSAKHADPAIGSYESLLHIIDKSGRDLVHIINNLLDLDSTSRGIQPKMSLCNLYDLEEEVVELAMQGSSRSKISKVILLAVNELPDHTDTLVTDPVLLRQIIGILVQNALDATDHGSVIIRTYLNDLHDLVIDVIDTGKGIQPDDFERIFVPFVKVDSFSHSAGLGLSFAARYAEALNGSVKIAKSTIGRGSHFRFQLPRPVFSCRQISQNSVTHSLPGWSYYLPPDESGQLAQTTSKYVSQCLDSLGCKPAPKETATFVISHASSRISQTDVLADLHGTQMALVLVPAADFRRNARTTKFDDQAKIIYCGLPLCRNRLLASLMQMRRAIEELKLEGADQSPKSKQQQNHRPRFLLVDDNPMNLNILQAFCKKRKHEYVLASDGKVAYQRYVEASEAGSPISVTLMDLQMPICDGIEATTMIRKYEQENDMVPSSVFMVTGQSGQDDKGRAMEAGSDGYYVKPLRLKVLDELLATLS